MTRTYEKNGAAIYRQSFAIIRAETDLSRFSLEESRIAVRIVHACGTPDIVESLRFHPTFATTARMALLAGAPILCDAKMVAQGITRPRLPAANEIICTLDDPRTPILATELQNTRSAAAMELWRPHLEGALVVIGNAPTALFHLLDLLDAGAPRPAAIIGVPVGFVGAAESKQALTESNSVPWLIVEGRRGGSAMAVAAVNALASETE